MGDVLAHDAIADVCKSEPHHTDGSEVVLLVDGAYCLGLLRCMASFDVIVPNELVISQADDELSTSALGFRK